MKWKDEAYAFVDAHSSDYPVTELVKIASVSRSGYYKWKKRGGERAQERKDQALFPYMRKLFEKHRGIIGRRNMKLHLKNTYQIIANEKRVRRMMKKFGLRCQIRQKKFQYQPRYHATVPNILDRDFKALKPGVKFAVDITYIPVKKGVQNWVYLCAIKDLFNQEIAAYATSTNQDMDLVFSAIRALKEKGFEKRALLHSDQGFQFTNPRFQDALKDLGLTQSMSRRGNCWDNACIENFFSHLKCEMPHFYPAERVNEIHFAVDQYIQYYNEDRNQLKLKMSPVQYRKMIA